MTLDMKRAIMDVEELKKMLGELDQGEQLKVTFEQMNHLVHLVHQGASAEEEPPTVKEILSSICLDSYYWQIHYTTGEFAFTPINNRQTDAKKRVSNRIKATAKGEVTLFKAHEVLSVLEDKATSPKSAIDFLSSLKVYAMYDKGAQTFEIRDSAYLGHASEVLALTEHALMCAMVRNIEPREIVSSPIRILDGIPIEDARDILAGVAGKYATYHRCGDANEWVFTGKDTIRLKVEIVLEYFPVVENYPEYAQKSIDEIAKIDAESLADFPSAMLQDMINDNLASIKVEQVK